MRKINYGKDGYINFTEQIIIMKEFEIKNPVGQSLVITMLLREKIIIIMNHGIMDRRQHLQQQRKYWE